MKRLSQPSPPLIQIRAVNPWPLAHGEEAAPLSLSAADQAELAGFGEIIALETKGAGLVSQGEPARFLYLLSEGVLMANHMLPQGDRQVVAFYWPGDLCGLSEGGLYVNSIETITACKVLRLPVSALEAFFLRNPAIQHQFLIKAVHDLRATQRRLIVMGRLSVARRLAVFLLDCSGHDLYFDASTQTLTLPMSRYDIADYLGTSAESVARSLASLEEGGLARRITPRSIELRREEMKAFADLD